MKSHLRTTIETLLARGESHREIERRTGVDRKTIRRYHRLANSPTPATGSAGGDPQTPPPRPPAPRADLVTALESEAAPARRSSVSACEAHRAWIETQLGLGRNATSIYQNLVERHEFAAKYNSVKRFVATLRARAPERFDVLEFLPGEEAQVDYGQGAPTRTDAGKYKRPYLFVMTLKYSGKSFRCVVWKTSQAIWAELHERAFRAFGGTVQYVVLDNLKEGVIRPDIYEPELNPVYAAMLTHYGVVADPCRVRDPNRKGSVESAIQHTQGTALTGRTFASLEAQNTWLAHWEAKWAAPRIHGRKKRQVLELYHEELPALRPLPLEGFRVFTQGTRTVDDAGLVQIEGSYYTALPAALYSAVTVRIYPGSVEILDRMGQVLRRHEKAVRKGTFVIPPADRLFNPSRETVRVLARVEQIGPHTAALAQALFATVGRPGNRALYGLASLARTYTCVDIEAVCERLLAAQCVSYAAVKGALARRAATAAAAEPARTQSGPGIRAITDYQHFWELHSTDSPLGELV